MAALTFFERNQVARRKFAGLEETLELWCEKRREKQRETDAVRMQLGQLEARKEKLTDALIDGLIDKDAFQSRNEKLLFEHRRLQEKLRVPIDPDAEKERLRKFLEQVKSLAPLYDSAKSHEKRNIVRWATSNRTVAGKSVEFKPSNWLEAAQFVLAAPYGEGQRPTPRTPTEMLIRRLDELNEFLKEEKEPDLLRDLLDMFDRLIRADVANPDK